MTNSENGQETFVGGIPLTKIQELVSEAMTAADHHKKVLKSINADGEFISNGNAFRTNARQYGSANSVVWDDSDALLNGSKHMAKKQIISHSHVNQVLNALQDKKILSQAQEIKPLTREPVFAPISEHLAPSNVNKHDEQINDQSELSLPSTDSSSSSDSGEIVQEPQNIDNNNNYNIKNKLSEKLEQHTEPDYPGNVQNVANSESTQQDHNLQQQQQQQQQQRQHLNSNNNNNSNQNLNPRSHQLKGLLKKGYFGDLANEIRKKEY